jgi:hypothetical protein
MTYVWKSMELAAIGALSVWGTHRAVVWLHESPLRECRTGPAVCQR